MSNYKVYMFWTNNTGGLTPNRIRSINQFSKVSGAEVVLVTNKNLHKYILPEHPVHPAYRYLSAVHRSDYLRTYFMHFHGGGYSDIKMTTGSWVSSFEKLNNSEKMIIGYKEIKAKDIAGPPDLQSKWMYLIGNGAYICKPNTKLTKEWYTNMIKILDYKLPRLQRFPAMYSRDHAEKSRNKYPIKWTEILGSIFHPLCYKYKSEILYTLPSCVCIGYM